VFSTPIQRLNDRRDAVGDAGEDAGFTLIELMVVLLILAILLAIAIPTFLGVTKSANDRAAQSNLNTALVNAKSIFQTNGQSYAFQTTGALSQATNAGLLAASLLVQEPSLTYISGAVSSNNTPAAVSVQVSADGTSVALAEQAKGTGTCWYVIDNTTGSQVWTATMTSPTNPVAAGTWYGKSTATGSACNAAAMPLASVSTMTWQQSSFPN
jgi:type IV pilus assembly protein PilA